MDLLDITIKVICIPVFANIVENAGVVEMLKFANSQLIRRMLPVPTEIVSNVNNSFGHKFKTLCQVVTKIIHECEDDRIPQLKYIEPKYASVIEGPSPKCITSLLYGNKVNINLTSQLLEICDESMHNLEMVSCSIVLIPTGTKLKPHSSEYCGVMTYVLVVEGSTLLHMSIGSKHMTLNTKAAVLYDPIGSLASIQNSGPSTAILLKIDFYRPFDIGFDAVNWSIIQVMSESYEIQQACNLANM